MIEPGKKLEVLESKHSGRMTPNCIGFTDGKRLVGEEALALSYKNPKAGLCFGQRALGLDKIDPLKSRFVDEHIYVPSSWNHTVYFDFPSEYISAEGIASIVLDQMNFEDLFQN